MTYSQTILETSAAGVFAALADPTRQVILGQLRTGPKCVSELGAHMSVSRPAVSQHLKVLKSAGLVREDREGTRHYFGLAPAGFAEARRVIDVMWHDALGAFAAYVTSQERLKKRRKRRHRRKEH